MADKFLVSRPAGNRIMNLADDDLRENARTIKASLEVEHSPFDGSDEVDGKHTYVTLAEQVSDIAAVLDRIAVYGKEANSITELFVRDSAGNVTQLTAAGENFLASTVLHRDAGSTDAERFMEATLRMANNVKIRSRNVADDADLNLIYLNVSDVVNIGSSVAGDTQGVRLRVADDVTDAKDEFVAEYGDGEKKIWHEGNDGAASGLDADLVHGVDGADMMKKAGDASVTFSNITSERVTTSHGLASAPNILSWYLEKFQGGTEGGYDTGDRVMGAFAPRQNQENTFNGITVGVDANDVFYAHASNVRLIRKNNNNFIQITEANWRLVTRVWL